MSRSQNPIKRNILRSVGRRPLALSLATSLLFFAGSASPVLAWSEHALGVYPALSVLPEIRDAARVRAESLEDFLLRNPAGLAEALADQEKWARANLSSYAPLPDELRFKVTDNAAELRARFLKALRVNPEIRTRLYIQILPGESCGARPKESHTAISIFTPEQSQSMARIGFCRLRAGETVAPLRVVSSGVDEPDYGHDINLWGDSPTSFAESYSFGPLPFGDPRLYYATQAPFHMAFLHESSILYLAAPILKQTYPRYRVRLFARLAEFAFRNGSPYWGYRFMGWGLHYITDLTQPYHATVVPGYSTAYMMWINIIAGLGFTGPKDRAISLVSNRHTTLEEFQMQMMHRAYRKLGVAEAIQSHPVISAAARLELDADAPAYNHENYIEDVLSLEAYDHAEMIDGALMQYLPEQYVNDPDYRFSAGTRSEIYASVQASRREGIQKMNQALVELFEHFGVHSRVFVRGVLADSTATGE